MLPSVVHMICLPCVAAAAPGAGLLLLPVGALAALWSLRRGDDGPEAPPHVPMGPHVSGVPATPPADDPRRRHGRRTVPTKEQWGKAILRAWRRVVGGTPSARALSVLYAQWGHETGDGASMWCWNFAGIKGYGPHTPAWSGEYCWLKAWEILDGKRVDMHDRFRSYPSIEAGAEDYLRFLQRPGYKAAWAAMERGDAGAYARELKRLRYYTGDEGAYATSMERRARTAGPALASIVETEGAVTLLAAGVGVGVGAGGAALAGLATPWVWVAGAAGAIGAYALRRWV